MGREGIQSMVHLFKIQNFSFITIFFRICTFMAFRLQLKVSFANHKFRNPRDLGVCKSLKNLVTILVRVLVTMFSHLPGTYRLAHLERTLEQSW